MFICSRVKLLANHRLRIFLAEPWPVLHVLAEFRAHVKLKPAGLRGKRGSVVPPPRCALDPAPLNLQRSAVNSAGGRLLPSQLISRTWLHARQLRSDWASARWDLLPREAAVERRRWAVSSSAPWDKVPAGGSSSRGGHSGGGQQNLSFLGT